VSVPNFRHVPQKLYDTGFYDLRTDAGHDAFTDAVVTTCHGLDPNFRHLKKSSSQTHIHRHGEDSMLYLLPNNQALAIDFIGGAGGPNPQPGWLVGDFVYKHSDAHDPSEHGIGQSAAPAQPNVLPKGEALTALEALNAFYAAPDGLQRPGGLVRPDREGRMVADMEAIAQWFYQLVIERRSPADVYAQIRSSDEWKGKHPGGA
jgi:hypothetical protein